METIVERPAGLDVHKAQVTACVRVPIDGGGREQHVAEFPTTVTGLLTLRDWLAAHRVEQVTMEATGVYWKPVWAMFEDEFACVEGRALVEISRADAAAMSNLRRCMRCAGRDRRRMRRCEDAPVPAAHRWAAWRGDDRDSPCSPLLSPRTRFSRRVPMAGAERGLSVAPRKTARSGHVPPSVYPEATLIGRRWARSVSPAAAPFSQDRRQERPPTCAARADSSGRGGAVRGRHRTAEACAGDM